MEAIVDVPLIFEEDSDASMLPASATLGIVFGIKLSIVSRK